MKLRIDVQQATFAAGDRVAGEVVVLEGGRSRGATIELRFVERSLPFEPDEDERLELIVE